MFDWQITFKKKNTNESSRILAGTLMKKQYEYSFRKNQSF